MESYRITYSGHFKKDLKKHQKRPREFKHLTDVLKILEAHGVSGIPERMRPHKLAAQYSGFWECHVLPDLLLIWDQGEKPFRFIYLIRLGSHSELF